MRQMEPKNVARGQSRSCHTSMIGRASARKMQMAAMIVSIFAILLPSLAAQNVRWDLPVYTVQSSGGNLLPVYAVPGALVSFYNEPAGTLASTYNSATSASACPTGTQVVLNGSSACSSSADPYGNMGAWFLPGQYMATITSSGRSYNYYFTVGGGSAGQATGDLTSIMLFIRQTEATQTLVLLRSPSLHGTTLFQHGLQTRRHIYASCQIR